MSFLLKMPSLGENIQEGRLFAWKTEPGKAFCQGDTLAEIATDMTVVKFPARGDGMIIELLAEIGQTVAVGDPIARIAIPQDSDWTSDEEVGSYRDPASKSDSDTASTRVMVDLVMPKLGETMEEGVLVGWLVKPGAPFKRGDPLVEIETDKTVSEFPALVDGLFVESLAEIGKTLPVGTKIARIEVARIDAPSTIKPHAESEAIACQDRTTSPTIEAAKTAARPRATPLARRIAFKRTIDLTTISGTGRRGRIEGRDVEGLTPTEKEFHQTAGLVYLEKGPADGTPVLLLHGFAADHTAWSALQSQLARVGHKSVSLDLPGHGRSKIEAHRIDDLHPPVSVFLSQARMAEQPHVVAHSMGAIVAVRLARVHRFASLTLISPVGLGQYMNGNFIRGLANAQSPGEVAHLLRQVTDAPQGLSQTMIDAIHTELSKRRLVRLAETLVGPSGQAIDIRGALAELATHLPVRLILGHRDRILDWREALDVSPRIAVHHLPRAGHTPQWEALPEILILLMEITEAKGRD